MKMGYRPEFIPLVYKNKKLVHISQVVCQETPWCYRPTGYSFMDSQEGRYLMSKNNKRFPEISSVS